MKESSIIFSSKELELLTDKEFPPLKQKILAKLEVLLGLLHKHLKTEVNSLSQSLPGYLLQNPGKISRGENFRSYAYRVLDYPSFFQKTNWLFFRTQVMWGHHISYHLLVSGKPLEDLLASDDFYVAIKQLEKNIKIGIGEDPWDWLPQAQHEVFVKEMEREELEKVARSLGFLKLSHYLPLAAYKDLVSEGLASWNEYQKLISKTK